MSRWSVRISPSARRTLLAIRESAFEEIKKKVELLESMPYLGGEYEPRYEAARLPFACRVVYAGSYGLYYTVDEAMQEVYIRYVENQRSDPRLRFREGE